MTLPENILETIIMPILIRIVGAVIILLISRGLAGMARSALKRALAKTDLTDSFVTLFTVLTFYSVFILGILVALAILGVPVASLVAGISLILIVLGIAMQQSLGNFAATVIFLLFKPFEVGDIIESGGFIGVVKEIELFNTVILTADQKVVTLPNGKIQGAGITNYSKMGILRSDMVFGIGYEDDITKAKQILEELVTADGRILTEPETQIAVVELGDSSVNIAVRSFVKLADYWNVPTDMTEKVKLRFDEAGISIPYPQRDVHIIQSNGQTFTG
jgi:small conductance mechanosensitive channel